MDENQIRISAALSIDTNLGLCPESWYDRQYTLVAIHHTYWARK